MASSSVGMVCLLLVSWMVVPSLAKVYTVGDTPGWTTGVDYSTWTKDKTFKVGDSLVQVTTVHARWATQSQQITVERPLLL
ncbi:hypothetical protein Goshw_014159 [Gossypium schwendimanii]|uniref:Phytocyanin domain-containing protein n=1 Tax=Gossypium schwendimanii TaxID=34291 RepID=A0A7J9M5F4_GOSSC|nr:hypothetical protein [Gossypium schwendimanii]